MNMKQQPYRLYAAIIQINVASPKKFNILVWSLHHSNNPYGIKTELLVLSNEEPKYAWNMFVVNELNVLTLRLYFLSQKQNHGK